jgi:hypothetical protein
VSDRCYLCCLLSTVSATCVVSGVKAIFIVLNVYISFLFFVYCVGYDTFFVVEEMSAAAVRSEGVAIA